MIMTIGNETGEWIFSDEYHQWQDEKSGSVTIWDNFRPEGIEVMEEGWYYGLFSWKSQDLNGIGAQWPDPAPGDSLA